MTKETYKGWGNYETWLTAKCIENEQASYEYWRRAARRHLQRAADAEDLLGETETPESAAAFCLSEQLRETISGASSHYQLGIYVELVRAALRRVDWLEITQRLVDELPEAEKARSDDGKSDKSTASSEEES